MIYKKDLECNFDQMVLDLKEITKMDLKREKESLCGMIILSILGNLVMEILKGLESITGVMGENMLGIGNKIRCMEKGCLSGVMDGIMMESTVWIRRKGMECSAGLMGRGMKDIGKLGSSMEKGYW